MHDFETALKEQIINCKIFPGYRCGIYIKHPQKTSLVMDELTKLLEHNTEVERLIRSLYNAEVCFKNGSVVRVIYASDGVRGCKNQGAIIDCKIDIETLRCIILPTIMPRWVDQFTMEPWEEVEKRIFYCYI